MCILDHSQGIFRLPWKIADDQCSSISKGSNYHIKDNVHTTFQHRRRLTRKLIFNGSIYYVLYLHILHFYFAGQIIEAFQREFQLFYTCTEFYWPFFPQLQSSSTNMTPVTVNNGTKSVLSFLPGVQKKVDCNFGIVD